jgi:DNA adenine methylase
MKSPLRWNGGKRDRLHVYSQLLDGFPTSKYHYIEPMLGGGSVFYHFGHLFKQCHIGDYSKDLVNFTRILQTNCEELITELSNGEYWYHATQNRFFTSSKLNFHRIRDHWYEANSIQLAARYLYINRACINGLMRINGKGRLNPGPGKTRFQIDFENLRQCSQALQGVRIFRANALEVVELLGQLSQPICWIVDPPYHDERPGRYKFGQFGEGEQARLARALLSSRHPFIYSNKCTELTMDLFQGVDQFVHRLQHKTGPGGCRNKVEQELWAYRL